MCGIAGVAGAPKAQAQRAAYRMMVALERRGPDGAGLESWDGAVLSHRRLAIFDTSDAGAQPMRSPDGRIGVVFNGAIYNFRSLRAELAGAGYTFLSNSDTEVLVHGYDAWGIERLVSKLHGMFAFAVWDDARESLYLVRDRLGVKPLLYTLTGGICAFASTAQALVAGGFADGYDDDAIADVFETGYVADRRCIFRGFSKLPAAHIAQWHGGELRAWRYWRRPDVSDQGISFEEAVEHTERLLLRAVELRLQADVPADALLLSAGIDSTLIAWACKTLGADVTAYTARLRGDPVDETGYAVQTARALGMRHEPVDLSPENAPRVQDLLDVYSEPFACTSSIAVIALCKRIKPYASVVLTGDGGDDVFLGYPRFRNLQIAERFARLAPHGATHLWKHIRASLPGRLSRSRPAHFLDFALGGVSAVELAQNRVAQFVDRGIAGERLVETDLRRKHAEWSVDAGRRVLDDFLQLHEQTVFVGQYLPKIDSASMHFGIEARSPLLDQHLWEYAARLPYDLRLHNGTLKAILREIVRRRVDRETAYREKIGFVIPVERWMSGPWKNAVLEAFEDSYLERQGWIRRDGIERYMRDLPEGEPASKQVWHLWVLELWMKAQSRRETLEAVS
jgi:asparagine synthase (glutamine-hydrolysing)